jgi:hypothetical protein
MDDETIWRWRWRCPEAGCGQVIQGSGSERDRTTAEVLIRAHEDEERLVAQRAS